tara:strand:+ start:447 stop:779 length:333 start_codon:yes stop_codon:yes gene_type:complete
MNKPSPFFWFIIFLLLILPSAAGKFILNIAGSLIILFLLLPILIAGGGWLGWKVIKSKFETCSSCGTTFMNTMNECPICGNKIKSINNSYEDSSIPASSATIDIKAEDAN